MTLARIRPTTEAGELAQCNLVVEAILEDYELKANVIREFGLDLQSRSDLCDEHFIHLCHSDRCGIT